MHKFKGFKFKRLHDLRKVTMQITTFKLHTLTHIHNKHMHVEWIAINGYTLKTTQTFNVKNIYLKVD